MVGMQGKVSELSKNQEYARDKAMRGREGAKGGGLFIDQKGEGGSGFIEYRFIFKDVKGFKDSQGAEVIIVSYNREVVGIQVGSALVTVDPDGRMGGGYQGVARSITNSAVFSDPSVKSTYGGPIVLGPTSILGATITIYY